MKHALFLSCLTATVLVGVPARAQLPECSGHDPEGASAAFEEGNRLMAEAIDQAGRRRLDRARELAAEALTHFDQQCALGDASALAERGAALMLMGEALRSAQSYEAYLAVHPLSSLDARTRRRIEANLQPGRLSVTLVGDRDATLFVDDLDFGPLPRHTPLRLPVGEHELEARDPSGEVLADATALVSDEEASITLTITELHIETEPDPEPDPLVEPEPEPEPEPTEPGARMDFTPFYIATGVATGVFLGLAIGLQLGADDRAQTFNRYCVDPTMPFSGCDAVLSEYDGMFGASIASWILAGLATAGLVTVLVLDLTQAPRERVRISFVPTTEGASAVVFGRF
jgi:hypothetical protein